MADTTISDKIYQGLEWRARFVKEKLLACSFTDSLIQKVFPTWYKQNSELAFWKNKVANETTLNNAHYEYFYTQFFGIDKSFYAGKSIADIGCGPRGSLEWASMASERVGIDPLASEYLKLGADKHAMTYVSAPSEKIPYPSNHFDVICSFNSLDHVANFAQTAGEIKRLVKPGGLFLLIAEVNHEPTVCEPIALAWDVCNEFSDTFTTVETRRFEIGDHDIYGQLRNNAVYNDADPTDRPGVLVAKMIKKS